MSDMGIGESMLLSSIIGGGASLAGGALANKRTQTTTPTIDPAYKGLQGQVLNLIQQRLATPIDTAGYGANGVASINRTYGLTKQTEDNNLTARGLATSPVAATVDATRENARAGDIATFQNSIPLLVNQLRSQDLSQANGILGQGRGSTTTDTGGGGAAGAFTNLAGYLGYLQGKGSFGGGGRSPLGATSTVSPIGFLPGTGY